MGQIAVIADRDGAIDGSRFDGFRIRIPRTDIAGARDRNRSERGVGENSITAGCQCTLAIDRDVACDADLCPDAVPAGAEITVAGNGDCAGRGHADDAIGSCPGGDDIADAVHHDGTGIGLGINAIGVGASGGDCAIILNGCVATPCYDDNALGAQPGGADWTMVRGRRSAACNRIQTMV